MVAIIHDYRGRNIGLNISISIQINNRLADIFILVNYELLIVGSNLF